MRISDWSSDVCSSDLQALGAQVNQRIKTVASLDDVQTFAVNANNQRVYLARFLDAFRKVQRALVWLARLVIEGGQRNLSNSWQDFVVGNGGVNRTHVRHMIPDHAAVCLSPCHEKFSRPAEQRSLSRFRELGSAAVWESGSMPV